MNKKPLLTYILNNLETLCVDGVTILFHVPRNQRKRVIKQLTKWHKNGRIKKSRPNSQKGFSSNLYEHSFKYTNRDGVALFIQAQLRKDTPNSTFLRLEFNPTKFMLSKEGLSRITKIIKTLLGDYLYNTCYSDSKVSGIHLNYDIAGITPNDILVYINGIKISRVFKDAISGDVLQYNSGSNRSNEWLSVYHKTKELGIADDKLPDDIKTITRFEYKIKPKTSPEKLVDSLPNLFYRTRIFNSAIEPSEFDKQFLKLLDAYGLQKAVTDSDRRKKHYMQKLAKYDVSLFDAKKVWRQLPEALVFLKTILRDGLADE